MNGESLSRGWLRTLLGILPATAAFVTPMTGRLLVLQQPVFLNHKSVVEHKLVVSRMLTGVCTALQNHSLRINANGFDGVIGPIHLTQDNTGV
jgi:hypothetical protein